MRFLLSFCLFIITSCSYSMEEDQSHLQKEIDVSTRYGTPKILKQRFEEFRLKWNKLSEKKREKPAQISRLTCWGVQHLLPQELILDIAYHRIQRDVISSQEGIWCQLCKNNVLKVVFAAYRANILSSFIINKSFTSDSISQNGEQLNGKITGTNEGQYYTLPYQLELGSETHKIIFSDTEKSFFSFLGVASDEQGRYFFDGPNKNEYVCVACANENDSKFYCIKLSQAKDVCYSTTVPATITACAIHPKNNSCAIADTLYSIRVLDFRKATALITRQKQWLWENLRQVRSEHTFKKLCFITKNTLLGLTEDGRLMTIALDIKKKKKKREAQEDGITLLPKQVFEQKFLVRTEAVKIPLFIKDFALNSDNRVQLLLLAEEKNEEDVEQGANLKLWYVNLTDSNKKFSCVESKAAGVKNIYFHGTTIGLLQEDHDKAVMEIQRVNYLPCCNLLALYGNKFVAK